MSFGIPAPEVQWAILLCLATPLVLLLTRWLPVGVAHRFNITAATVVAAYLILNLRGDFDAAHIRPLAAGFALIVAALVFVLGFWGVLTRGYSVALLIALERLGGTARAAEIETAYSGGRGLRWLAEKRLSGLLQAGVITVTDDQIAVTDGMGMAVLRAYLLFRKCFRLKEYG
jgi:hypothetical protein